MAPHRHDVRVCNGDGDLQHLSTGRRQRSLGARVFRQRHPRGGGMRVGFRDLTSWSFFMASAHGAGFMLLPVLLGSSAEAAHSAHAGSGVVVHSQTTPMAGLIATVVHTMGYLAVTGLVAWVIYNKLGLALLRKAWINLHLIWAVALIISAAFTLLI